MPPYPGVALITGASSGIGATFAKQLAQQGMPLALVARRQDRLEELAASLPVPCNVIPADLSTAEGCEAVEAAVKAAGLEIGLLILSAGFGQLGPMDQISRARQLEMVDLNCRATVDLTHRFLPGMRARGRGGIILVSSTAAFQADPWVTVYGATKAFDLYLAEGLAEELRGTGVDVMALCPGPTQTEFSQAGDLDNQPPAQFLWSSPEAVVRAALAGLGRKTVVIPGFFNWLAAFSVRLGPRVLSTWVAGLIMKYSSPRMRGA